MINNNFSDRFNVSFMAKFLNEGDNFFIRRKFIKVLIRKSRTDLEDFSEYFHINLVTFLINLEPLQLLSDYYYWKDYADRDEMDNYHGEHYYHGEQLNASLMVNGLCCYTPVIEPGAFTRRYTRSHYPKRYWKILPKEILEDITQRDIGRYYAKRYWEILPKGILGDTTQRNIKEILGDITPKRYWEILPKEILKRYWEILPK
ncbi:hypothetical protein Tco_1014201 [Tanacetum coccineum]